MSNIFEMEVLQQRYNTFIHLFKNGLCYPSTIYYIMKSDAADLLINVTKLELSKRDNEDEQIKSILLPVLTWIENNKKLDRNQKLKLINELVSDLDSTYLLANILGTSNDAMELIFDKLVTNKKVELNQFIGSLILDSLVSLSVNIITNILHKSRVMKCFHILSNKIKLPFGKETAFLQTMQAMYSLNEEEAKKNLVKEIEDNEVIYYPYDAEIRKLMNDPEAFIIKEDELYE